MKAVPKFTWYRHNWYKDKDFCDYYYVRESANNSKYVKLLWRGRYPIPWILRRSQFENMIRDGRLVRINPSPAMGIALAPRKPWKI